MKFIFFILVVGAITFAITYWLGYWKEDVWKKDAVSESIVESNIQKLDSFF